MMGVDNLGDFQWNITFYIIVCWILAAFGGLMFGYDIGVSGGVTGMDDFLVEFFPSIYERKRQTKEDNYCKYDDQFLQLFTSSIYISALFSSFAASKMCSKYGRKPTILFASLFYLIGSALSAGANQARSKRVAVGLCLGKFPARMAFGFKVNYSCGRIPFFEDS
ncbi:hypothetical protein MLD38_018054 [Melastoma candidum]|uniref:Uncharacterized protein n=1 Tax=Melastoma candidum TaxID=119954 RepID=A0ACB9QTY1_9MYRT|nr:hypothetical protein MLD38_018054 [Melastoma candidum]